MTPGQRSFRYLSKDERCLSQHLRMVPVGECLTKMPTIILFPISCPWVVPYHSDSQLVMWRALANRIIMINIKIETQKVLVCWDLFSLLGTLKTTYWDHTQASVLEDGRCVAISPHCPPDIDPPSQSSKEGLQRPSSPSWPEETLRNHTHFCYLTINLRMVHYSAKGKELVPHSKARETQWHILWQRPWLGNTVLSVQS